MADRLRDRDVTAQLRFLKLKAGRRSTKKLLLKRSLEIWWP